MADTKEDRARKARWLNEAKATMSIMELLPVEAWPALVESMQATLPAYDWLALARSHRPIYKKYNTEDS